MRHKPLSKKIFCLIFIIFMSMFTTTGIRAAMIQNPGVFVSEVSSLSTSSIDPATVNDKEGLGFIQLMYEGLFQYTNNSLTALKPDLATDYYVSNDGLTYNFTIRSGVTFSLQSGENVSQPFNAYVMQYSIDRAIIINDHSAFAWIIDDWIQGAQGFEGKNINMKNATDFLSLKSVWASDATHLQITLRAPFVGFIQTLKFPVTFAVSPKAIIDNKPASYTTNENNQTNGMVSLASFFPGTENITILRNLGLPTNYNIDNSGVVPQSDHTSNNVYAWSQQHSAGTGPYNLVDIIQHDHVDMAININWWDSNDFQTKVPDKIKITQVTNQSIRINDLINGSTDTVDISRDSFLKFGFKSNHEISNTTGVLGYVYNSTQTIFIGMNQGSLLDSGQVTENATSSNYNYGTDNITRLHEYSWNYANGTPQMANSDNPFSALLFREAFAYSFPTSSFITGTLEGFGQQMQGVIPDGEFGHDNQLVGNGNIPTFNSTEAKIKFNEVGWQGIISVSYVNGSTEGEEAANLLKLSIENLGVNLTININSLSTNEIANENMLGRKAILILESPLEPLLPLNYADPYPFTNQFYASNGILGTILHYNNPSVNTLINEGVVMNDPSQRSVIYHQIETNATGDFVYIYVAQYQNVLFIRDWINGIIEPNIDLLNPMLYFLPLQFLAKGSWGIFSLNDKTTSSNLTFDYIAGLLDFINSPIGFLLIIFGLMVLSYWFYVFKNSPKRFLEKNPLNQKSIDKGIDSTLLNQKLTNNNQPNQADLEHPLGKIGKICSECHQTLLVDSLFCPNCGKRV